jgi:hypothetical protein
MPALLEMVGRRFGRLLVTARAANTALGVARWRCLCDCGTARVVLGISLRSGNSKSCGCKRRDDLRTHGLSKHPLYGTWSGVRWRCVSADCPNYADYGGRGIQIWPAWRDDPARFIADVTAELGERPVGLSLDRIDNDGDYRPGNLRWATQSEQTLNQRPRVKLRALAGWNPPCIWHAEVL